MNQDLMVFILEKSPLKNKGWGVCRKPWSISLMLVHIGFLYFIEEVKLFISIVLVLIMSLKKLKDLSGIKTSKQAFFEYNQTIQ